MRNIPEDAILHSHRRENLKTYISFTCLRELATSFLLGPNSFTQKYFLKGTFFHAYLQARLINTPERSHKKCHGSLKVDI
jgi:hypothetical protein